MARGQWSNLGTPTVMANAQLARPLAWDFKFVEATPWNEEY